MAQEVQRTLDYQAELNLIEWVWHQENRVKEHTQVEAAFGYECSITGSTTVSYVYWQDPEYSEWTFTLVSQSWATEFKQVWTGVRIPLAWPYLVNISVRGGSSSNLITHSLRAWDKELYSVETSSSSWTTNEIVLNLGRYDVLNIRWKVDHSWSGSGSFTVDATLNIKRL
jgi:hypothetical protein